MVSHQELVISKDKLLKMLRKMIEIRKFEECVERLYREGRIQGPTHLYIGQEGVAVGVVEALDKEDVVISNYRGHGHGIARGVPMKAVLGEILGRSVGTCKGLGGSMHAPISVDYNIPLATAIVGSGIPIAVGVALGFQYRKSRNVAVAFFGDGAVNTGAFHEALNLAAVWNLPVLFVCENNLYAMTTSFKSVFAGESIASRAACYGMPSYIVSGSDVVEVYQTAVGALERIRSGGGPAFIECRTYRFKGHGAYDLGTWYRPKEEIEEWLRKDPIVVLSERMKSAAMLSDDEQKMIEDEVNKELDKIVDEVLKSPVYDYEQLPKLVYSTPV
ncbi:MAG: thiamine pyrophosphate-dependent dehydrogenase E1 component subunit alpha [Candidatus Caldarchaeum sp.]|nr:thiamine pyrophosphate-dependent dehydrogenase E1 component subunit alpha [Candidatus Caldarchaeum sp.]